MDRADVTFQEKSYSPYLLAMAAQMEIQAGGMTKIRCPKCNTAPVVRMTEKGERTIVTCQCGYLHSVDINF